MESASSTAAVDELRGRGWLVLDVRETAGPAAPTSGLTSFHPLQWLPVRSLDIELSLRQMAVMLRSGLTLLDSLITVADQAQRPAMARIWRDVAGQIQEGASLADAMGRHGKFSAMVVELVRVGGATGHLEPVLTRAAEALERRRQLRTSMLTALAYPTIVLFAALGVTAFMVFSVIPKLEKFLSTIGRRLPPMTQMLMDITHGLRDFLPYGLALAAVVTAAAIAGYCWPPTRLVIDRLVLRIPVVGVIFRLAGTVSFAGNLGALLHSGIRILEGLRTVERLQRNQFLALQIAKSRDAVMHGTNLAGSLATPHAFMPMLSRMVAVGESAGTLDEVLDEVARFYESQLQSTIRRLSVIVEPVIIVIVGGIVGFVYISFFMALFAAGGAS
ncbi:MAG: type II secretion system F family protein [Pirellulaceae bacterium]|nr:type II secretion system F family protein [Pirellulaceae bacterium]